MKRFIVPFLSFFSIILLIIVIIKFKQPQLFKNPTITPLPTIIPPKIANPQFVLLSLDGSRDLKMWQNTRNFAKEMKKQGINVNFTYFISGVYFLPYKKASFYHPPSLPTGSSKIGFADSEEEVPLRINEVNLAINEGHEIASHLNGHFQGGSLWDKKGWISEISQFKTLLINAGKNSNRPEIIFPNINKIVGMRTPNLSKNTSLYPGLEEQGYLYDSSQVGKPNDLPYKIGSVWEIPLKNIPLAGTKQTVISMDYNFWSRQTDCKETAKKGTNLYNKIHDQTLQSYLDYFNSVYSTNKAPVVIGHHFSLWNDEVYWQVMQDFVKEVCGRPEVVCATFSQYVQYLDKK